MHIKQHNSDDLCFSPTYSLLCSVSIPVEQLWVKKVLQESNRKHASESASNTTDVITWKHDKHTCSNVHYHAYIMLLYSYSTHPASGPLNTEDVQPLSTHMQHFNPPRRSWTSSENNFPPPTKLSKSIEHEQNNPDNSLNYVTCISILLLLVLLLK